MCKCDRKQGCKPSQSVCKMGLFGSSSAECSGQNQRAVPAFLKWSPIDPKERLQRRLITTAVWKGQQEENCWFTLMHKNHFSFLQFVRTKTWRLLFSSVCALRCCSKDDTAGRRRCDGRYCPPDEGDFYLLSRFSNSRRRRRRREEELKGEKHTACPRLAPDISMTTCARLPPSPCSPRCSSPPSVSLALPLSPPPACSLPMSPRAINITHMPWSTMNTHNSEAHWWQALFQGAGSEVQASKHKVKKEGLRVRLHVSSDSVPSVVSLQHERFRRRRSFSHLWLSVASEMCVKVIRGKLLVILAPIRRNTLSRNPRRRVMKAFYCSLADICRSSPPLSWTPLLSSSSSLPSSFDMQVLPPTALIFLAFSLVFPISVVLLLLHISFFSSPSLVFSPSDHAVFFSFFPLSCWETVGGPPWLLTTANKHQL